MIEIKEGAFDGNLLTSVVIPNSVIEIEEHAFRFNKLTSFSIPDSVTRLGTGVFNYNPDLKITVDKNNPIYSSNSGALYTRDGTYGLVSGTQNIANSMGSWITTIWGSAFEGNNITSVTIPNSLIEIGEFAFRSNNLTSVVIPNSVKTIKYGAFISNNLI